ncbi:MAG: hypothetical protein ACFCU7_06985 [Pleurocapsa sp.]
MTSPGVDSKLYNTGFPKPCNRVERTSFVVLQMFPTTAFLRQVQAQPDEV